MTHTGIPRTDVCIIGAGPAGALLADTLAAAGHDVVVLEAGPRFDPTDRLERMERSIRPGDSGLSVWDMGGKRDAYTSSGENFYPLNHARVKGVGGSTLHWQGMVMRLHESDFAATGPAGGEWPIDYDDLRSYYANAEQELGVAGAVDNPFSPPRDEPYPMPAFAPSHSDSIFAEACEALEITTHSVGNARNSVAYDGRSQCVGYGTCNPVCPSGAKYSADTTIEKAEAKGVRVVTEAPVQRLETTAAGERVEAAIYAKDGRTYRQEARQFILAAGGVEIPRLLLLSASDEHPDGLANSSGAVGRYFMEHLFAGMGGVLSGRETRQNHVGFMTTESHQFYDNDEPGIGPIKLEFLNYAGPSPVEIAMDSAEYGDDLLETLKASYGHNLAMGALVGQEPRKENYIGLDPSETDDHGNPVPDVHWRIGEQEKRTIARANEIQQAVLDELGVDIRWKIGPENTGPTYHHMGTTRMGTDPETSVVDARLRCHDVANLTIASSSVFVTSGAMNPTLTIAALALRAADFVDESLKQA
ncbi:GMC family oxidoreductase [Haladaptatus sp. DJG-WS-42]|uniref:GMC family oxidoreductase n=1 Tax=Haladaptatus sp. DJG-WS-42 TaxID=3120516 RepID=UPI0030D1C31F